MSITVIIPTVGRESLMRAVASCEGADEILVVVDDGSATGPLPVFGAHVRVLHVPECNRGGHSSRNHAMPFATSTHLAFLDDDDEFLPGAIDAMRAAACDRPVIFRMDHPEHGILPVEPEVRFGNVSTQMFLVPNDPARLGVWAHHRPELPQPGGDFTFISECVAKMGGPVWDPALVAVYRPDFRTVAIVTPWLDHPELARDYLTAVGVRSHRDELIVVDDGSRAPLPFARVKLAGNHGFAGASNAGLEAATADIVVFLNNDVSATRADWIDRVRAAVEPGVLVGGRLRYDPHGAVDGVPLPYLDGWCLAGMRDDLLSLGGWDEGYEEPSYYGDNDLSLRARAAGFVLREVQTGLLHKEGATTSADVVRRTEATERNQMRFIERARDVLAGVAA